MYLTYHRGKYMNIAEQLRKSETMSLESVQKRARDIADGAKLNQEKDLNMLRLAGVSIEQFVHMVNMARQIPAMRAAAHQYMKHEADYTAKANERAAYTVETKRIIKEREEGERRLRSQCGHLHALARESREAMAWLERYYPDDEILALHAKRKDVIAKIVKHEKSMADRRRELHDLDQSLSGGVRYIGGGELTRDDIAALNERRPVLCDEINSAMTLIDDLRKQQADIDRAIEQHLCGASQSSDI
jgi:hypothetical protein